MPVKKLNPVTPGSRFRIGNTYAEITSDTPEKSLVYAKSSTGGRNNEGHRTMRYRGGGNKKKLRVIDFLRDKDGVPATVKSIEYDPNRTAYLALLYYADGEKRYIIAPKDLKVGAKLMSGPGAAPEVGNTLLLKEVPLGAPIYNIELQPGRGGALVRSAGTMATLLSKEERYAVIKLPSSEVRRILLECRATIGTASNPDHNLQSLGKAGRKRWVGRRPRVRGVAMNPVDHPMGGGEGRASGGHPRSRNGQMAKGKKTRKPNKHSNILIISRRKTNIV